VSIGAILLPLFVEVALTFVLLFWMARSRIGAIKRKETTMAEVALGQLNWPPRVQQISNSYHSQFQLPLLFYVVVVLAILTKSADILFVVLSWAFVLSRIAHAYIHTGSNYVRHRFNAFALGVMILLAMWLIFAARIIIGSL
jgi:hypothetical protein